MKLAFAAAYLPVCGWDEPGLAERVTVSPESVSFLALWSEVKATSLELKHEEDWCDMIASLQSSVAEPVERLVKAGAISKEIGAYLHAWAVVVTDPDKRVDSKTLLCYPGWAQGDETSQEERSQNRRLFDIIRIRHRYMSQGAIYPGERNAGTDAQTGEEIPHVYHGEELQPVPRYFTGTSQEFCALAERGLDELTEKINAERRAIAALHAPADSQRSA